MEHSEELSLLRPAELSSSTPEECLNFDKLDLTCLINEPEAEQKISSVYLRRGTQTVQVPLQLQT